MIINNLKKVLVDIKCSLESNTVSEQLYKMSNIYLDIDSSCFNNINPFTDEYRSRVLELYKAISYRNDYSPVCEKTDSLDSIETSTNPIPYRFADSNLTGEYLVCYGLIMRALNVSKGAKVLEYGAGEGQLSINLARLGCDSYVVDIEGRFLESIKKQCDHLDITISTSTNVFGDGFEEELFDRVVFFEAFHHWFSHWPDLIRIKNKLKENGFICFSGEPIIKKDSLHKNIIPYPWGLRLDGESIRSINEFGWMELGFSEEYFVDLLMKSGFSVSYFPNTMFERAQIYLAKPYYNNFPIKENCHISTWDGKSGWHIPEVDHRWTNGDAWFPLSNPKYKSVEILAINHQSKNLDVTIEAGSEKMIVEIKSGCEALIKLPLDETADYMRIMSPSFKSDDGRTLGIAIKNIEFH